MISVKVLLKLFMVIGLVCGTSCVEYGGPQRQASSSNSVASGTGGQQANNPTTFAHEFQGNCAQCHEKDRPSPNHFSGQDCATCHAYPSWEQTIQGFSHMPKPDTCEQCHARPATVGQRAYPNQGPPANFDANNPGNGGGHYLGRDCASCHQTPPEGVTTFSFSHSVPNPGICLPCHYNNGQREHLAADFANFIQDPLGNCNSCHTNFDVNQLRNFNPQ